MPCDRLEFFVTHIPPAGAAPVFEQPLTSDVDGRVDEHGHETGGVPGGNLPRPQAFLFAEVARGVNDGTAIGQKRLDQSVCLDVHPFPVCLTQFIIHAVWPEKPMFDDIYIDFGITESPDDQGSQHRFAGERDATEDE